MWKRCVVSLGSAKRIFLTPVDGNNSMAFHPLSSHGGKRHLPPPTGPYVVGCCDLMTKSNLLLRCFYPTKTVSEATGGHFEGSAKWLKWLPNLEYADGYLRFKFSRGLPLVPRLFRWLIHDPYVCALENATVLKTNSPLPVVIFSHGMGAMRTTYSTLLADTASRGYFVAALEHRDGSAAATINANGTWSYERKLTEDEDEYEVRNEQVSVRVGECQQVFGLLEMLTNGGKKADFEKPYEPPQTVLESIKGRLDMSNCTVAGHSFGGATAVKAVLTSRTTQGTRMFRSGLLLDSWMFPLRKEAEQLVSEWKDSYQPRLLFVNCQNFQSLRNLKTMSHFQHPLVDVRSKEMLGTNVLTMRGAMHYAPTDIPTIFMGSWARYPFSLLYRPGTVNPDEEHRHLPAEKALGLCQDLFAFYMDAMAGSSSDDEEVRKKSEFVRCVEKNNSRLIRGWDYRQKEEEEAEKLKQATTTSSSSPTT